MRRILWIASLVFATTIAPTVLRATPTTFDVNLTIGSGSVTGTIITDGTTGTIGPTDILSYNLNVFTPPGTTGNLNSTVPGTSVAELGGNFSATTNTLTYDFSGGTGFLYFFNGAIADFCLYTGGECNSPPLAGEFILTNGGYQSTGSLSGVTVFATTPIATTPEPSTSGLMLIGVGLLGLVVMRKRIHLGHQQAT
jgi:PEP-CTERM motif